MIMRLYGNPKDTGWFGWIETKRSKRALAFIRLDGTVVWDW